MSVLWHPRRTEQNTSVATLFVEPMGPTFFSYYFWLALKVCFNLPLSNLFAWRMRMAWACVKKFKPRNGYLNFAP